MIDVTYGFTGKRGTSLDDAIAEYPNACGPAAWAAVDVIGGLLPVARSGARPVVYSAGFDEPTVEAVGLWAEKHPRSLTEPADGRTIVAEIAPAAGDLLIRKSKPSLFHGTPLLEQLVRLRADTLIVTGVSTSGCVRATVLDAFSYNFRVLVVEDAVFDRGELSHAVNLFDMDQKYASVVTAQEARAVLERTAG